MNKKNKLSKKLVVTISIALIAVASIGIASMAYWTERIDLSSNIGTLDIGIQYDEEALNIAGNEAFVPGQKSDINFSVSNTGKTSVDIKPVISIKSDKNMTIGGSEFMLVNNNDTKAIEEFEIEYFLNDVKVANSNGTAFNKAVYTAKRGITLAGSIQKDPELDKDVNEGKIITTKAFSTALKLSESSDVGFMGAAAEVQIKTYAMQHRNTEEIRQDNNWIEQVDGTKGVEEP
ncbi:MAG: hypothetical protein Q4B86_07960 [Eubacteriales bacterium]|nr:hypothetical protein [Eubacteriales bacterium]